MSSSHHLQAAAGFPWTPWHLELRAFCPKDTPASFKPRNEDLSKFRSLLPSSPKTKPSGPGPTWASFCSVSIVRPSIVWQIAVSSSSLILNTSFDGRSLWSGPTLLPQNARFAVGTKHKAFPTRHHPSSITQSPFTFQCIDKQTKHPSAESYVARPLGRGPNRCESPPAMGSSEVTLKASPTCASNHHVPCDLCGLKDCEVWS